MTFIKYLYIILITEKTSPQPKFNSTSSMVIDQILSAPPRDFCGHLLEHATKATRRRFQSVRPIVCPDVPLVAARGRLIHASTVTEIGNSWFRISNHSMEIMAKHVRLDLLQQTSIHDQRRGFQICSLPAGQKREGQGAIVLLSFQNFLRDL